MTKELEDFLNEIGKHVPPRKEKTLFSLGGRGYYENPLQTFLPFSLNQMLNTAFRRSSFRLFLTAWRG